MGFKKRDERLSEEFISRVSKLEAIEFLGLIKIFGISPYKDKEGNLKDRDFEEVFEEALEKFSQLKFRKKKEILKILKQANLEKEKEKRVDKK